MDEFILRAIRLGVNDKEDVRELLNLPKEVSEGVIATLLNERHLLLVPDADGRLGLQLSPSGNRLVETLVDQKPVEKPVTFSIDGVTAQPLDRSRATLMSAKELDDAAHLVVEPSDDIDLVFGPNDTARFLNAVPSKQSEKESLLSLLETESATKMYSSALGLLFESTTDAKDLYLRICVDGRSQEHLEEALRESGTLATMRLEARVSEDRRRVDRALGPGLQDLRIPDAELDRLRSDVARRAASSPSADGTSAASTSTSTRASQAQNLLDRISAGRLDCVSTQEALQLAMSTAQDDILISTSRFWPAESADENINAIRQLLDAGVAVSVEVPADDRQMSKTDKDQLSQLMIACEGTALEVWQTKAPHEANFVALDGTSAYIFASSPFADVGQATERFGDDRPTVVLEFENVQEVLETVHSRSTINTKPKTATRRSSLSRLAR